MSILSAPRLSFFLQRYMMMMLGPLLIVIGMFLTGLLRFTAAGPGASDALMSRADRMGIWGAALLGIVFALSFCPTSAALFFGSLVPLAVTAESSVILPVLYGIGTALPVVVFACIIATGAHYVGKLFQRVTRFELWSRRITGALFIVIGVYLSLTYIFHLL
jgi:cytochrome c biogenesis protein CcdA